MIRALRPQAAAPPEIERRPELLLGYLEDASAAPPGRASGLCRPASEAELASLLRATTHAATPVLFQAARTSLTGGAIPRDELVVSVERMAGIGSVEPTANGRATVTVEPGVRLSELRETLAGLGWYYPPVPTYDAAMIGGTVATNAAGAATFKYGATRPWVRGLRVVLECGDVLEIERGRHLARRGESFAIELADGQRLRVPVPEYVLPPLKKISAGYFGSDPLDLIDLFIGSEGTLGAFSSLTLELVSLPAGVATALVFAPTFAHAYGLADELRRAGLAAHAHAGSREPDVRSIEAIDLHGLELLRTSGEAARLRVPIPEGAGMALLVEVELASETDAAEAESAASRAFEGRTESDGPLDRLFGILSRHGVLEDAQVALPGDESRRRTLGEFREAVPRRVNELLRQRRRDSPEIKKIGGDLVVPFDELPHMMSLYESGFRSRGLEHAVWGHLSDGNLHPNALPRDAREVREAERAMLEFADEAVRLGGSPLSEHGVGRDPLKQELLRRFLGPGAIASMRRIKAALDPRSRLARGVLFP